MKNKDLICDNLSVNENGVLTFAGVDTVEMANKYGTPLFLMDEERIRNKCKTYLNAVKKYFGESSGVLYASKALSFKRVYEIMKDEGMGIDVVSQGEIFTAKRAGFPLEKAYFHSNNKTDADIDYAVKNGVGTFVVDNEEELASAFRVTSIPLVVKIKNKKVVDSFVGIKDRKFVEDFFSK